MGAYSERFQAVMDHYLDELEKAGKNRKFGDGLFGFGRRPGDDPCHEAMDRQVAELAEELAADEGVQPEETAAFVQAVFEAEGSRQWKEAARWAVLAIQRHGIPLITRMSEEDRRRLGTWYENTYPRRQRLPIQKQIVKELQK